MEIEIKYLVNQSLLPFKLSSFPSTEILQGYIALDESGTEVRVRQKGEKYLLTVKSSGDMCRVEVEKVISSAEFADLLPLAGTRLIKKTRFNIPHGHHTLELDVFHGELQGLALCEVEFSSKEEVRTFPVPEWFEQDVTSEQKYKNKNLALLGL